MPVRAKIWELEKKFGRVGPNPGFSVVCGPSGVGGMNAIVGGCGAAVTVAAAGIMTFGIGGLENVKGRVLIGGSSRPGDASGAWGIEVTEGGY